MRYRTLDVVVLDRELPDRGLRKGDLGAVVEVYEPDGLEVEFVTASGTTEALLTLGVADVRPVADNDLVTVSLRHGRRGQVARVGLGAARLVLRSCRLANLERSHAKPQRPGGKSDRFLAIGEGRTVTP